jgi:hypothetical protein
VRAFIFFLKLSQKTIIPRASGGSGGGGGGGCGEQRKKICMVRNLLLCDDGKRARIGSLSAKRLVAVRPSEVGKKMRKKEPQDSSIAGYVDVLFLSQ